MKILYYIYYKIIIRGYTTTSSSGNEGVGGYL